jgi:acetyl-CoA carboxylase biotin carboxylase subunit
MISSLSLLRRQLRVNAQRLLSSTTIVNKPFDKILIANRGEISSRVMRTCKALDIETVAIYSIYDSKAPYVSEADSSICIGKSYLDEDRVLRAIQESGAQACMPGYGFFSGE